MLAELVEVRDAGPRGGRGLFARAAVPPGAAVVLAEDPLAFGGAAARRTAGAAAGEGERCEESGGCLLRLLVDALGSDRRDELAAMLCKVELPEETRAASRSVAGSAVALLRQRREEEDEQEEVEEDTKKAEGAQEGLRAGGAVGVADAEDLLLRLYCNTHSLDDGSVGVYAQASAINHDCDPNCTFFTSSSSSSSLTVRALRAIGPGEELTIGYVPLRLPQRLRAAQLRRNYGFDCTCQRCLSEGASSEEDREEAETAEKALGSLAAKVRAGIGRGDAALEPSPLTKMLSQAKLLAPFQEVLAGQILKEAAEAFAREGRLKAAAVAYHEAHLRARAHKEVERGQATEELNFLAPYRASLGLALADILVRLASHQASSAEESRVALGRAAQEAGAARALLAVCRGPDHEATARAATLAERVAAMSAARKKAVLLGKLLERQQSRLSAAGAQGGGYVAGTCAAGPPPGGMPLSAPTAPVDRPAEEANGQP